MSVNKNTGRFTFPWAAPSCPCHMINIIFTADVACYFVVLVSPATEDLDSTTLAKLKQDKIGLIRINRETKRLSPSSSPKHQRGSWESKCQDVMVVGTASIGTMKLQQSYGQVQGKSEVCFSVHTLSYQAGTTVRGDPPNT